MSPYVYIRIIYIPWIHLGLSASSGMYKSLYICLVYYFLETLDLPVILQQKKIPNIRIHTCQNWPSTPSLETSWVTTLYGMLLTLTWQIQASPYYETLLELQQSEEILSGAWFSIMFRSTAQSMKEGLHMRGCSPLMITKSVWSWIDTERTRQKCNFCKWEKSVPIRTFPTAFLVRATPKSNSVDNVRALQGDATVLEKAIKLWWEWDNNRTLVDEGGSSHNRWWES